MADKSRIEWTQATWNPVSGCTKVSPGCAHCYAESFTLRFRLGNAFVPGKAKILLHPERMDLPQRWKTPRVIFVNSMSDLFHEEVPAKYIRQVFQVMESTPWHTFQVLTKRHERLLSLADSLPWPSNLWMGVSVESQWWADRRIPALIRVPSAVRFLSCEPLLSSVNLVPFLGDLQWVIAGGESGLRARKVDPEWVRQLRDDCRAAKVPFFFKQWGGRTSKAGGRALDGQTWDELPRRVGGARGVALGRA